MRQKKTNFAPPVALETLIPDVLALLGLYDDVCELVRPRKKGQGKARKDGEGIYLQTCTAFVSKASLLYRALYHRDHALLYWNLCQAASSVNAAPRTTKEFRVLRKAVKNVRDLFEMKLRRAGSLGEHDNIYTYGLG